MIQRVASANPIIDVLCVDGANRRREIRHDTDQLVIILRRELGPDEIYKSDHGDIGEISTIGRYAAPACGKVNIRMTSAESAKLQIHLPQKWTNNADGSRFATAELYVGSELVGAREVQLLAINVQNSDTAGITAITATLLAATTAFNLTSEAVLRVEAINRNVDVPLSSRLAATAYVPPR